MIQLLKLLVKKCRSLLGSEKSQTEDKEKDIIQQNQKLREKLQLMEEIVANLEAKVKEYKQNQSSQQDFPSTKANKQVDLASQNIPPPPPPLPPLSSSSGYKPIKSNKSPHQRPHHSDPDPQTLMMNELKKRLQNRRKGITGDSGKSNHSAEKAETKKTVLWEVVVPCSQV
ncbi:hypothetical protein [Candidatus Orientia mediorientalis]|nr:hypothetical protein [Candidatus Orientia mediorientalis]